MIDIINEKVNFPIENELKQLGVTKVICFVAKGWRGHVFKVRIGAKIAALKISTQERILRESSVLKKANAVGVGPKIYGVTKHCVAMQFIYGKRYPDFIENTTKKNARQAVLKILKQAEKLDKVGIDHGELSRADKHIIVRTLKARSSKLEASSFKRPASSRVYFIDFEKGSTVRKTHNFGSVLNYLLLNPYSFPARATREKLNISLAELKRYARANTWRKEGSREKEGSWTRSWARVI